MLRYMAQAATSIQHIHSACFLLLFVWAMPNKRKEIYTDVGYGHTPYYAGKAICFWFICADGVDQAKFRVRRALTYHFVVADADMKKLIARQTSMTCTKSQMLWHMMT